MTRPNTTIVKTPRPVYYLMGRQAQGNSHPGSWSVLESSTDSEWILDQLDKRYNQSRTSLFYTDLAIHLDMGSIDLTRGEGLMNFEQYCRRLQGVSAQSIHQLLTVRANALRQAMEDGVVRESTACNALHNYAKELEVSGDEWRELDELMKYERIEKNSKGEVTHTKVLYHAPLTAREDRGDFSSPYYRQDNEPRRYEGEGYVHSLPLNVDLW